MTPRWEALNDRLDLSCANIRLLGNFVEHAEHDCANIIDGMVDDIVELDSDFGAS